MVSILLVPGRFTNYDIGVSRIVAFWFLDNIFDYIALFGFKNSHIPPLSG